MKRAQVRTGKSRGRPRSFDVEAALERAMQVFWEQGYESTSIADLTKAMNINPPSLYAAFGDKERLFLAAVERYEHKVGQAPEAILNDAPTARAAIEQLLEEAAREFTNRAHPPGCMIIMSATTCSAGAAHVQAALASLRRSTESALKARIERGVAERELPVGTETGALARFFVTVLEGMSIQARDGASRKSLLATAATAMRAWPQARTRSG
jgi:AcrR family transcriptional regulator